jgi:hypothetical protein
MTLQKEPARQLLQTIANALATAFDAQHKIKALEEALKKCEPNLFAHYQKEVEFLRQKPPFEVNHAAFAALLEKLVQ